MNFAYFNKKNILLEKFLTDNKWIGLCSMKNAVYVDVVCMFYANLNTKSKMPFLEAYVKN